ncbi:asparaginase [Virgibacillus sp. NKC19-16]|uniref:asparaginase n=1 Tax=Virgibacillus salidurans TaxID=2831673 RepID=UPI001F49020B|nr:asparaginase [Virgibacillus sp. NKC19-16]UJL48111.1 asparaginase [Virgibacillus sp. NKC19-16]
MKNILLIHTGGTISMLENKETGEVTTAEEHPLTAISDHLHAYANVDEIIEFDLPSPQITPQHMLKLAKKIEQVISMYDGIVVTHGTDTLEETAYFLDLVLETEKPIILTGAMRSSNEIGSDALYNLISSLRVSVEDEASRKGVLVVMNDEIHTAKHVTKTSTSNIATFQSPQYGPIGIITKDAILFHHTILSRHTNKIHNISKNVFLLKSYAGMDARLLEAIYQAKADGIVIEGLGQGNLPKETLETLKKIMDDHIPVILTSRCYQGTVQPTYSYDGGGKHLKEMGVILANSLTGPKARIKLLIELENTTNGEILRQSFAKN